MRVSPHWGWLSQTSISGPNTDPMWKIGLSGVRVLAKGSTERAWWWVTAFTSGRAM